MLAAGPGAPRTRRGLDQIVVGAAVQPLHAVLDRIPGREHEYWRLQPARPKRPADLEAVASREHDVEDYQVEVRDVGPMERLIPVAGHVDGVALLGETPSDELGYSCLVFNQQHLHRYPVLRPSTGNIAEGD